MEELIKVSKNGNGEAVVSARELHAFLEVKTLFKDWISRRVEEYGFEDGKDFSSFLSESLKGRPSREYAITLDMAKELAMVERNEKGRRARQYFIECEKRLKDPFAEIRDPQTVALVRTLVQLESVKREQEKLALEQQEQSRKVAALREEVAVIEARTQPENRHYTVMGWARLNNMPLPVDRAAHIGRRCANLSRQRGLPIGDAGDPRFGKVHSYHDSVLEAVFRGTPPL